MGMNLNPAIRKWVVWIPFLGLLALNYWATLKWMVNRWDEPESYMSHGWLIPPISLFLAWQLRKDWSRLALGLGKQSGWETAGFLALFLATLFIHLIAGLADISSISGITLIFLLAAFIGLSEGRHTLYAFLFPVLFLLFMVPPPEFVISGINFKLKLAAADIACQLLNATGMGAIREGSFMLFTNQKLAVGDVCSGLRSLLSLIALGVLYAYLVREKGWKHILAIVFSIVPAAILGNGLRICLVCYLVEWLGSDVVFKPLVADWDLHLITGAFIFASALGCLILVSRIMDWIFPNSLKKVSQ